MKWAPQVIVVGSGPAGVSATWPLVRAGIDVLMIDASSDAEKKTTKIRTFDQFHSDPDPSKNATNAGVADTADGRDISPKFSTPQAKAVLDGFLARNNVFASNFFAAGSLARGGLSKIWGALAVQFEDHEFSGYPFAAAELHSSYNAIINRIGVSGGPRSEPNKLSSTAARLMFERFLQRRPAADFGLQLAANAVLDISRDDRQACSRCGLCLFGCNQGSIYDSSQEIPALLAYRNFKYGSDHFVRSLDGDGGDHILEVEIGGALRQIRAPIVVLAAGTIASSGLALRRLKWVDRPVRLLTNPAAAIAFVMPALVGCDLPEQSFALGQLFYRARNNRGEAAGVIYGAEALPLDLLAARLPLTRPLALRIAHALAPAMLMATCYLPGSFSQNTLTIHTKDGKSSISIHGAHAKDASAALDAALAQLKREMFRSGSFPLPGSRTFLKPGADAHYAGTLPMGASGEVATSIWGELKGCPNLFVVDGASLPHLPAAHPTLTIMANADRIGHEIARRLQGTLANCSASVEVVP